MLTSPTDFVVAAWCRSRASWASAASEHVKRRELREVAAWGFDLAQGYSHRSPRAPRSGRRERLLPALAAEAGDHIGLRRESGAETKPGAAPQPFRLPPVSAWRPAHYASSSLRLLPRVGAEHALHASILLPLPAATELTALPRTSWKRASSARGGGGAEREQGFHRRRTGFDAAHSPSLTDAVRQRLISSMAGGRVRWRDRDPAQRFRTQEAQSPRAGRDWLADARARELPTPRIATTPTKASSEAPAREQARAGRGSDNARGGTPGPSD